MKFILDFRWTPEKLRWCLVGVEVAGWGENIVKREITY